MLSSSYGKKGEDARPPARSRAVRKKLLLSLLSAAPRFPLRRLPRQAEQRSCIDDRFINLRIELHCPRRNVITERHKIATGTERGEHVLVLAASRQQGLAEHSIVGLVEVRPHQTSSSFDPPPSRWRATSLLGLNLPALSTTARRLALSTTARLYLHCQMLAEAVRVAVRCRRASVLLVAAARSAPRRAHHASPRQS